MANIHPFIAFCRTQGVTITANPKLVDRDRLDAWKKTAFAWDVQLTRHGKTYTTDYWCGSAHAKHEGNRTIPTPPTAPDVLASLLSDASTAADLSFEEWAADLGMSEDSRAALATYEACRDTAMRLAAFLGTDYDAFVEAAGDW